MTKTAHMSLISYFIKSMFAVNTKKVIQQGQKAHAFVPFPLSVSVPIPTPCLPAFKPLQQFAVTSDLSDRCLRKPWKPFMSWCKRK